MNVKAIETVYQGYRFRSRLEARWAVFFDAMGIKWEYESEGFDLGEWGFYLPDFWLPKFECFAEVKPDVFSEHEREKAGVLPKPCIMLSGVPAVRCYPMADLGMPYEEYLDVVQNEGWCVWFEHSVDKGRIWYESTSNVLSNYDTRRTERAVKLALGARWEHGEYPQVTP